MLARQVPFFIAAQVRGTITNIHGQRNNRSRVQHLSFQLNDANLIRSISSVLFQINTADGTERFRHTLFNTVGSFGGHSIGIVARDIPARFRAGANNRLAVSVVYNDELGTASASGEAGFTTEVPEQAGTATLTFPNANSVRSEVTDPNGIVAIQLCEFILPGGSALNATPVRLSDNSWRGEVPLGTFGAWTCNWTYSDSLGSGKTASARGTR